MKPRTTVQTTGPGRPRRRANALVCALLCSSLLPGPLAFAQTSPAAGASGNARNARNPAEANRFRGEPVTLNFVNADIEGVTRAMAAILKQQFIVDPRVKGNITLYNDEPLPPREAYLNFLAALRAWCHPD